MRIPLANRAETVRLEATLIEEWGIPQLLLMERAALGVAEVVQSLVDSSVSVTALVGPGNNGADALAVCRLLHERGFSTRAFRVGGTDLTEAMEKQLHWLSHLEIPVEPWSPSKRIRGVLLDGVFGFGLSRAPEGVFKAAIEWANAQDAIRVAIDLPSGLFADTGTNPGIAMRADHTVACGTLKTGLVCDPALPFVGTIHQADIGFPPSFLEALPGRLLSRPSLPARAPWAYKGTFGSLLIVGGSSTMSGAPTLAAKAAVRSGVGLVYVLVPPSIRDVVAAAVPEAIVFSDSSELPRTFEKCQAALVGPGMTDPSLAEYCWNEGPLPTVFDAGALLPLPRRTAPAILTPHPGEAARLLSRSPSEVQANRLQAARSLAERSGALVTLKGARTLIADEDEYRVLFETSPLLATAGSGDVLAGLMGGLLAQGLTLWDAAGTAVALQGRMALFAEEDGRKTLPASELLPYFDRALWKD